MKIFLVLLLSTYITFVLSATPDKSTYANDKKVPIDATLNASSNQSINPDSNASDSGEEEDDDDSLELLDLRNMLETDDDTILIWKIQNGEPVAIESTNYEEFKSENTYIVLQGKSNEDTELWKIFYWIGKRASMKDAADAASYAVLLDSICHSNVSVRRIPEGSESHIFKSYFETRNEDGTPSESVVRKLDTNEKKNKKMYLVKGKNIVHISEVDLSLNYVNESEHDCIVLNSEAIYVYCGSDAEVKEKVVAKKLATIFENAEKTVKKGKVILIQDKKQWENASPEEQKKIKQFLEEFSVHEANTENLPTYLQKDDIEFEKKRDADISLIEISNRNGNIHEKPITERPLRKTSFKSENCYVLDSSSLAGIFVWIGAESEVEERQEAVQRAEQLLREKKYTNRMPINIIEEDDINDNTSFNVQFADFLGNISNQSNEPLMSDRKTKQ